MAWMEKADFECKIVIGGVFGRLVSMWRNSSSHPLGNHDISLDRDFSNHHLAPKSRPPQDPEMSIALFTSSPSITYLAHTSATIALTSPSGPRTTFKVFGSPSSAARPGVPSYFSAFQYSYGPEGDNKTQGAPSPWDAIPSDTDILITHTPPLAHVDRTESGHHVGCPSLRRALRRVRPRLAVCGHVHAARGAEHVTWGASEAEDAVETWTDPAPVGGKNCLVDLRGRGAGETCVVNCAVTTERDPAGGHRGLNKPIVVDAELPVWE